MSSSLHSYCDYSNSKHLILSNLPSLISIFPIIILSIPSFLLVVSLHATYNKTPKNKSRRGKHMVCNAKCMCKRLLNLSHICLAEYMQLQWSTDLTLGITKTFPKKLMKGNLIPLALLSLLPILLMLWGIVILHVVQ